MSVTQAPARNPYHKPKTVDELTERNVELVAQLDETARAKRTPTDRVVDGITGFCGKIAFIWVHVLWFTAWMVYNFLPHLPKGWRFDPYPWPLLLMIVNLEAIFLSTFILISQNRQNRLAERRSHLDLQINLLSEQENTKMLMMLHAIVNHFDIPDGDPEVSVLAESTEPERLVAQIEKVIDKESQSKKMNDGNEP
jgi:uncharacterized membrane protein